MVASLTARNLLVWLVIKDRISISETFFNSEKNMPHYLFIMYGIKHRKIINDGGVKKTSFCFHSEVDY